MTANANQKRQPKGTENGGQFAPDCNPESTVVLDAGLTETQRLTQDAVRAYLVASQTERPEGVVLPVGVLAKRSMLRALDLGSHRSKGDHSAMKLLEESGSSGEPRDNFLKIGAQSVVRTRSVQIEEE